MKKEISVRVWEEKWRIEYCFCTFLLGSSESLCHCRTSGPLDTSKSVTADTTVSTMNNPTFRKPRPGKAKGLGFKKRRRSLLTQGNARKSWKNTIENTILEQPGNTRLWSTKRLLVIHLCLRGSSHLQAKHQPNLPHIGWPPWKVKPKLFKNAQRFCSSFFHVFLALQKKNTQRLSS